MKTIVAIIILTLTIVTNRCTESKPHVEVEKQRLIEIATDDTTKGILQQQSEDTRRIYNEIAKINEALGYTNRAFPSKIPAMSHEGYFYPRASEQLHLPVFLRTPSNQGTTSSRYLAKHLFGLVPSPFNQQTYYYPAPYLRLPLRDEPRLFRAAEEIEIEDDSDEDSSYIYRTLPKTSITPEPVYYRKNKMTKLKKNKKVADINTEVEDLLSVIGSDDMSEIEAVMDDGEDDGEEEVTTKIPRVLNDKFMMEGARTERITKQGRTSSDREKANAAQTTTLPVSHERPSNLKTFGLGGAPVKSGTKKPSSSGLKVTLNETQKETVKAPNFVELFQTPAHQALKDVMKEGGIVIQRLKVRKGGIAIAGPGGVATAGSGGTAIVGPGGLALTHPRGLSIAGPGAKVVSIPEHVDLQKVALKASARSIPVEGMLVATGPVVYYNP